MIFAALVLLLMDDPFGEVEYWWWELRYAIDLRVAEFFEQMFTVLLFGLIWTVVAMIIAIPMAVVISAAGAVGGHSSPGKFLKWYATSGGVVWFIGVFLVAGLKAIFNFSGF